MATADQQARAASYRIDYEMKFYVGGKWGTVDIANIQAGEPYTPSAATTLAEDVDSTETSIDVVNASALTLGAVVILPTSTAQVYELVSYTGKSGNTLTGCTRNMYGDEPYKRLHNSGDSVVEWADITDLVTDGTEREDLRDSIGSWSVSLSGINYNSVLLDNDNTVLCLARWRPGAGGDFNLWTSWSVYWIGMIRDVTVDDDAEHEYAWTAKIESWLQYLDTSDAPATYYGLVDLADNATVQVSSTLADPFVEAESGEFVGSPELGGDNIVDSDMGTLWISEGVPIASGPVKITDANLRINEMYLRPTPGMPAGLRWIEIVYTRWEGEPLELKDKAIVNHQTEWSLFRSSCDAEGADPGCLEYYAACTNNFFLLPDRELAPGKFIIMTNDKPSFLEHWGETGAAGVYDWRHRMIGSFDISPTGGKLAIMSFGMSNEDDVFWGTQAQEKWYHLERDEWIFEANQLWNGANLPAMDDTECPVGSSYHRYPDAEWREAISRDNWEISGTSPKYREPFPTPGTTSRSADPEWAAIDLGEMGITLEEAIPASGAISYILLNKTLGLTLSGVAVIDSEYFTYTLRDTANNKLTGITRGGGSGEAAHLVDSPVYQREDGVTYHCYQVAQVGWRRRTAIGATPSVPMIFDIYFSSLTSPIMPDHEDWDEHWGDYWPAGQAIMETNFSADGLSSVSYAKTVTPRRARWVLIAIHQMTDGGHAKLNEVSILAPAQAGPGDITWSGDIVRDLLVTHFGLLSSSVSVVDRGTMFIGMETTKQPYSHVISDLLERTGCILVFGRDSTVYHIYDPRLPISELPSIEIDWNTSNTVSVDLTRPFRHNCSQVILRAQLPILDEVFEVKYPEPPLPLGAIEQVDDQIAGSLDQAFIKAQLLFMRKNAILTSDISISGLGEWISVGQRHTVTWELDTEGTYLQGRNFIVTGVQRSWAFGNYDEPPTWSCSLSLEELVF